MSKSILMIETGGTFATEVKENGLRGIGSSSVFDYDDVAEKVKREDFVFETRRPFRILSENMTIGRLESLMAECRKVDFAAYDGVIVTHGTDTLAYSVNLIAFALGKVNIPFVFVSADRPLSDPRSNGLDNFIAALDLIAAGEKGVFAVYRNGDGRVYVHRGGRLCQMDHIHPGFFSAGEVYAGEIVDHRFIPNPDRRNREVKEALPFPGSKLSKGILQIHPYPGLDYSRFSLDGVEGILHETYHTGMFCAAGERENLDFLLSAVKRDIPVVVVGGTAGEERYESDLKGTERLIFVDDTAAEAVYAKMMLALANLENPAAVAYIQENILGETL